MVDLAKLDRLYDALTDDWIMRSIEVGATPTEAVMVTMRMFAKTLASLVADPQQPWGMMSHSIDGYMTDAKAMAQGMVADILHREKDGQEE